MFEQNPTRQHIKAFHRRWYRRPIFWIGLLILLIIIFRLVLDPIARHYTQKTLDNLTGYEGVFKDVHVTVLPPGYEITQFKMIETPAGRWQEPLIYADKIRATLVGRQLLRGHIVAKVRIDEPKVNIIQRSKAPTSDESATKKAKKLPNLGEQLSENAPKALLDRVEIRGGEVLFRDMTQKNHPEFWLHDLELAIENIATRAALAEGRPTVLTARAVLQKSGRINAFISADPWAKGLTFAGQVDMKGLKTAELFDVIDAATDLHAPQGTIDVFAEFKARDGRLSGGVKPLLKNVEIRPTESGIWNRLKGWVADKALDIISDDVPGRDAVATVIPIKGTVENPSAQLWPTIFGVIRNAFVVGVSSGFSHLPPPTAEKKEGILEQAKEALQKDKGPPDAQPQGKGR